MLIAALALTVLGFGFLVAAVATGEVVWAWACIIVGGLGLVLLIVDVIRGGTARDRAGDGDEGWRREFAGAPGGAPGEAPDNAPGEAPVDAPGDTANSPDSGPATSSR